MAIGDGEESSMESEASIESLSRPFYRSNGSFSLASIAATSYGSVDDISQEQRATEKMFNDAAAWSNNERCFLVVLLLVIFGGLRAGLWQVLTLCGLLSCENDG